MAWTKEDWVNAKWALSVTIAALLFAMGKLDATLVTGLLLGAALPLTDIATRAGLVKAK